jgi:hypothetical protein
MLKRLSLLLACVIAQYNPAIAAPIPYNGADYIQHRATQPTYGAAVTLEGSVNHLIPNGATVPLNKALWLTFPSNTRNEWIEIGGGKGLTSTSIAFQNPYGSQQTYFEGHYMTYQTYDSAGNVKYHEGRIQVGSGVPSGNYRAKLQRDLSTPNKWCSFINDVGAYCITLAGAGNYTAAQYVTIGIESQDTNHSFTSGTRASNIWTYPFGGAGFEKIAVTPVRADNVITGARFNVWNSTYTPRVGTAVDAVNFLR